MLLFFFGPMSIGCGRDPLVSINLMNRTGGQCQKAEIELKGKTYWLTASVPNGNASISGGWPYPMPAKAKLHWITEDKIDYEANIDIPPPPRERAEHLRYDFVILPEGRANVAVTRRTEAGTEQHVKVMNDMGRDGGPNYKVGVKNALGVDVKDLDVRFGPYAVNAGKGLNGSGQNYSIATGLPYPITKSATVRWTTKDGHAYKKVVDLPMSPPSDFNDACIWFILSSDGNVIVQVVNWTDLRAGKHPDLVTGF